MRLGSTALILWAAGGCAPEKESVQGETAEAQDSEGIPKETGEKLESGGESGDSGGELQWPSEGLVLDRAVLIDASGRREGALLISGGEILAELAAGQEWPPQLEVRDLGGMAVIPGLIDSHVHLGLSGATWWVGDTVADNLRAQLYWGVLGVQDPGGPRFTYGLRDRLARGELIGPRIAASGPFLTAEGSHPCEVTYYRDLCEFVSGDGAERAEALAEADWLKVALADNDFTEQATPRLDLADLAEITSSGRPVLAHITQSEDASDALAAGVSALAHPVFAEPVSPEVAGLPFEAVHSTLSAFSSVVALVDGAELDGPDFAATPASVRLAWKYIQENPDVLAEGWAEDSGVWAGQLRENLGVYHRREAPVIAGSDAGYWFVPHGRALHSELEALVEAGWSPIEALAAATSQPAAVLGWGDAGWLGAGYRADLVVLEGDPSEDITQTREIRAVVSGGVWREREELLALDLWQAPGGGFCLDDRDCGEGEGCDQLAHDCVADCADPYAVYGACDAESWCMPADGLASTPEGVCHPEPGCDWRAQDCAPERYRETCAPLDVDTSTCWPVGRQQVSESCSWSAPDLYCDQGLFCSWVDYRCYEICDPDGPDACSVGRCNQELAAPGVPWFGLCY